MEYIKSPVYLKKSSVIPQYKDSYNASIENPLAFWEDIAKTFLWEKKWQEVFDNNQPTNGWFNGGRLNITINALDRHVVGSRRNKVALFWSTESGEEVTVTYDNLQKRVCQVANGLKSLGVKKGDQVLIYMPNTVETIYAMLACARIGATHILLNAGLGRKFVSEYLKVIQPKCIFLSDILYSGGKKINLKQIMDAALSEVKYSGYRIVHRRQEPHVELRQKTEVDFYDMMNSQPKWINPEIMYSSDPLFMIFTSKPNTPMDGFVHSHAGYMVGAGYYTKIINDFQESDISWCTSDLSTIEGHTNLVYGPMLNGGTIYFREGSLVYPSPDMAWRAIDKHGINILSTTPDILYELKALGCSAAEEFDHSTLRLVSVLSAEVQSDLMLWIKEHLAGQNGAVIDTWFNAELGAPLIGTVLSIDKKLGRTGKPYPGVAIQILDSNNKVLGDNEEGYLSLKHPIPSMNQTMCGVKLHHQKLPQGALDVMATKDHEGYITIKDWYKDSLFIGGHWISTEDIESYLMHIPILKEVKVWLCNYSKNQNKSIAITATIKQPMGGPENLKNRLTHCLTQEFGEFTSMHVSDIRSSS
jgi:acetyl-CoA synthetase